MPAKKDAVLISTSSPRAYQTQLQNLYARRSVIDHLIQSLQDYDRFRAQCSQQPDRKSA